VTGVQTCALQSCVLKQEQEYLDAQHQRYLDYESDYKKQYENRIGDEKKVQSIQEKNSKIAADNQKKRLEDIGKKIEDSGKKEIKVAQVTAKEKIGLAGDVFGILSGFAEQGTDLQKALALGQVAIDTGIAISGLTASTSSASPDNVATGGLAGFAKFATGIIKILANIAQAMYIIDVSSCLF